MVEMVEAARTTASSAAIWTICIVAVGCLAFWLGALAVADKNPYWRHWRAPGMPGPVLGGMHLAEGGRSVAPDRDAAAVLIEPLPEVPAQRDAEPAPTATRPAADAAGPVLPAQRTGDADRPEHSVTDPGGTEPRRAGG